MRFAVMHVWPEFRYLLSSVPATALVEVGVVEDDERRDPVNPSFRTSGLEVISAPMAGASAASPVTIESTPTGSPASSARTPTASADSGVCSAGFSTIVHPAASAGAAFRVTIADGEFHGVIPAETPTGSCSTRIRRSESGEGIVSGEEQGEIVEVLEHQVAPAAHDPCPVGGGPAPPARERPRGRLERTARLGRAHAGHACELLCRRRVRHRERLAGVGVDPAVVDECLLPKERRLGDHGAPSQSRISCGVSVRRPSSPAVGTKSRATRSTTSSVSENGLRIFVPLSSTFPGRGAATAFSCAAE
jgi:hypothetical protein